MARPLYEVASTHTARKTFIGNLYRQVKDPNLIASMSGHSEGSRAFARYRKIDDEMKKELVTFWTDNFPVPPPLHRQCNMNMDEQKQTYEQFKADILQWKDAHREEYTRFAKMMADGNEVQYLAVCRAIFRQLPGIKKEWQISWCDDSTDGFENIGLHFKENAVPE